MANRKPPMTWRRSLGDIIKAHNRRASCSGKAVSYATQAQRKAILTEGFEVLRQKGFKFDDVHSLREKHIRVLGHYWEDKGLSASRLQNNLSIFRTFSSWIGKAGMVRASHHYVNNPQSVKRRLVTTTDKTWSGQGADIQALLNTVKMLDERVACALTAQWAFGLRMKEAALLKPHGADKGAYLAVNWGTKGGRDRTVPVDTELKRATLAWLKTLVTQTNGCLIPKDTAFVQWRNHFYYICRQAGLTRETGLVSHGLRHEHLNALYTAITGALSPIKAQTIPAAEKRLVSPALKQAAQQEVAEVAGHSRATIAKAYLGR